jgi:trehalose-6-phosphate synthase/HAMP domain-containing protein
MRLTFRLSSLLIGSVAAVSLAIAFFQTRADTQGLRRDLESHAQVLAESLARAAEPLVERHANRELQRLVDRFRDREQIAGVSVYDVAGTPLAISARFASRVGIGKDQALPPESVTNERPVARFIKLASGTIHMVTLPLRADDAVIGTLALFHNAAYIDLQAAAMWRRALTGVVIQTILIAAVTLLTLRWGVGRPLRRMTDWLHQLRMGATALAPEMPGQGEFEPLTREVTQLASSLNAARAAAENEARLRNLGEASWTAERLRVFVQTRLGGCRLFAVSNREPYEHFYRTTGIECTVPASGLVTAMEPILRACDGTWIAQATGDADRDTADEYGRVRVPPDHPQYSLRRVWLTKEEEQGFYFGFANEGLWPLCHIAHTRPTFRMEDWEHYQTVNRRFAEALLEEIEHEDNPVVLVQDYHFALLPRLIKEARPDTRVAIFWHIPWPNAEAFGICPWQVDLLDGLLGADLIGFHLQAHCDNFLGTIDRALESRIEREHFAVNRNGHNTLVRPYPISVAGNFEEPATALELPHMERVRLLNKLGVRGAFLGVGVDRVDYTKGIPERFRGIERFLEKYPAYRGEFTFVQIGSPSRTHIRRYHDLMEEVIAESERINRRFQTSQWKPIVFLNRQHSHHEILPYYRTADLCLVTSLHDGMNLVAKEFVASREDNHGVLILSRFAGASHELTDALAVNPYDTEQLADSIRQALEMRPEECRLRMQRMRATVREHNVYRWAGRLIEALCEIRPAKAPPGPQLVRAIATRSVS